MEIHSKISNDLNVIGVFVRRDSILFVFQKQILKQSLTVSF